MEKEHVRGKQRHREWAEGLGQQLEDFTDLGRFTQLGVALCKNWCFTTSKCRRNSLGTLRELNIAVENHFFIGKIHYKLWCSIAVFNYQRVFPPWVAAHLDFGSGASAQLQSEMGDSTWPRLLTALWTELAIEDTRNDQGATNTWRIQTQTRLNDFGEQPNSRL